MSKEKKGVLIESRGDFPVPGYHELYVYLHFVTMLDLVTAVKRRRFANVSVVRFFGQSCRCYRCEFPRRSGAALDFSCSPIVSRSRTGTHVEARYTTRYPTGDRTQSTHSDGDLMGF